MHSSKGHHNSAARVPTAFWLPVTRSIGLTAGTTPEDVHTSGSHQAWSKALTSSSVISFREVTDRLPTGVRGALDGIRMVLMIQDPVSRTRSFSRWTSPERLSLSVLGEEAGSRSADALG